MLTLTAVIKERYRELLSVIAHSQFWTWLGFRYGNLVVTKLLSTCLRHALRFKNNT